MNSLNYVMIITGSIVILIGIIGLINPNWTKLINFPGGPRLKAIAAITIGVIFTIVGLFINIKV